MKVSEREILKLIDYILCYLGSFSNICNVPDNFQ